MKTKICSKCNEQKDISEFHRRPSSRDGYRAQCRKCKSVVTRARRRKPDYIPEKSRKRPPEERLKRIYGIDKNRYNKILLSQGGGCALCGTTQRKSKYGYLSVDHCHKSGRIRGLLCARCNTAIASIGDSPEALLKAFLYVSKPLGNVS